ncbi:MAG: hypothetical protein ABI683_08900 [Ginsengibacter sp.]
MSTDKGIEVFGNLSNNDTITVRAIIISELLRAAISNNDTIVVRVTDERKPGSVAYWKLAK